MSTTDEFLDEVPRPGAPAGADWRTRWGTALRSPQDDEVVDTDEVDDGRAGTIVEVPDDVVEVPTARVRRRVVRPIAVASGIGGGGVSVTSLLLTAALARLGDSAIAVDGTAAGGDLHRRAGFTDACIDWQAWLRRGAEADALPVVVGDKVPVLRRDPRQPDYLSPLAAAAVEIGGAGAVPVVDLGSSVNSLHAEPVITSAALLVLVIADRADAANRMRPVLTALATDLGQQVVREAHVVVVGQTPDWSQAWSAIRDHLAPRVGGVHAVPYHPALAWDHALAASTLTSIGLAETLVSAAREANR